MKVGQKSIIEENKKTNCQLRENSWQSYISQETCTGMKKELSKSHRKETMQLTQGKKTSKEDIQKENKQAKK